MTRAVVFNVKSNPGINIVLRVQDETGEVLQYSARRPYKITDPNGWYLLTFDLKAPPDGYWGGTNPNGILDGEISWLAIIPCNPIDRTPENAIGWVYITNARLIYDLPVANVPLPMNINDWVLYLGLEFPGALGSLTYDQGQTQQRKILLWYDLTNPESHYVSAIYNMPTPLSARAISFLVKPKPGIQVYLRVQDSTGQTLQYRSILPFVVDANGWYRQVVDLTTPPDGYWGGDGTFSGKVTSIAIIAGDPLHWDRTDAFGTLEIEDVEVLDTLLPVDGNLLLSNGSLWAPIYDADVLSRLGVVTWPDYRALDSAKAAGFSWIRTDLTWTRVEPEPGVWDFSYYDALLDSLDVPERNMKALFILDYGHPFYTGGLPPTDSAAVAAFGRFADTCARHFQEQGYNNIAYEIWNEQNDSTVFWPPDADPDDYFNLTQAVIQRLRAVDPNIKITTGGLALVDFSYLRRFLSNFNVTNPQYPDAIGVHPYRPEGPESATDDIAYWRAIIKTYLPTTNPPTWNTEWGYSSSWDGSSMWSSFVDGHLEENRIRQGINVARELLTGTALNFPLMIYYDIKDTGPDPFNFVSNTGLLDYYYNDKPAMQAVRTFTNAMKDCDTVVVLPIEQANVYGMYCHKNNGSGSTAIMWFRGPGQATVDLPDTGNYSISQITDVFGNEMQMPISHQLTLTDSAGPVYLNFGYNTYALSKPIVDGKQEHNIYENAYENCLYGSKPNPSKGLTMIRYSIKQTAPVKITVYNVMGQLVSTLVNEVKPAGMHSVQWNGKNGTGQTVSNGIYLYRIQAGKFRDTKKMIVVR